MSDRTAPAADPPVTGSATACIVIAPPDVLAHLLHLPPGTEIDAVDCPADQPGVLRLRLRGTGWPVRPGQVLREVRPTLRRLPDHFHGPDHVVIDWGLS